MHQAEAGSLCVRVYAYLDGSICEGDVCYRSCCCGKASAVSATAGLFLKRPCCWKSACMPPTACLLPVQLLVLQQKQGGTACGMETLSM